MKKITRIIAIVLVIATVAVVLSSLAFASSDKYKYGNNVCATVKTGKSPWYAFWNRPKIIVRNEGAKGSGGLNVFIYDDEGRLVKKEVNIKPGKSSTFTLSGNRTYWVETSGNPYTGIWSQTGSIEAKQNIKEIR